MKVPWSKCLNVCFVFATVAYVIEPKPNASDFLLFFASSLFGAVLVWFFWIENEKRGDEE